jgi:hypothetical protein
VDGGVDLNCLWFISLIDSCCRCCRCCRSSAVDPSQLMSICEVMQAFLDDDDSATKMILAKDELNTKTDVAGLELIGKKNNDDGSKKDDEEDCEEEDCISRLMWGRVLTTHVVGLLNGFVRHFVGSFD